MRRFLAALPVVLAALACSGSSTPDPTAVTEAVPTARVESEPEPAPVPEPDLPDSFELAPVDVAFTDVPRGASTETETEPNDSLPDATALPPGTFVGGENTNKDVDWWKVEIPTKGRWSFTLEGDAKVTLEKRGGTFVKFAYLEGGVVGAHDIALSAGTYWVKVRAGKGAYTLHARRDGDLPVDHEVEPNDTPPRAQPIMVGGTRTGRIFPKTDRDLNRFTLHQTRRVSIDVSLSTGSLQIKDRRAQTRPVPHALEKGTWTGILHPGVYDVVLRSTDPTPYRMSIRAEAPFDRDGAPSDLSVALAPSPSVAAYADIGQRVVLKATLAGKGTAELSALHPAGWTVDLPSSVELNGEKTLDVTVWLPPDLDALQAGVVTIAARTTGQQWASTTVPVEAVCGGPLQNPTQIWQVPDSLRGGLNVAAARWGATTENTKHQPLLSGRTPGTRSVVLTTTTVHLAGESPTVAGISLDGSGRKSAPKPVSFRFEYSLDGTSWSKGLSGVLERRSDEQWFPLDSPVKAQHVRLTFESADVPLGTFKVVASPGSRPLGPAPRELSAPQNGGIVVYNRPKQVLTPMFDGGFSRPQVMRQQPGVPVHVVLGFEHGRKASLGELVWEQPAETKFPGVTEWQIAISDDPSGPWKTVGAIEGGAPGETTRWRPTSPTSTRFVRMQTDALEATRSYLPKRLQWIEAEGPSITGEWGKYERRGPWELQAKRPPQVDNQAETTRNETRQTATVADSRLVGDVEVGEDVDVYRIDVPTGTNTVTLSGTSRARVRFETAEGAPLTADRRTEDGTTTYQVAAPSSPIYVTFDEVPRNIALLWDQSGSVSHYLPQIFASLDRFVDQVQPGKETANLYPFQSKEGAFLSEVWSSDPDVLKNALRQDDRKDTSSNAYLALLTAAREMEGREGRAAILMVTDAETSIYRPHELWQRLSSLHPEIHTIELHIGKVERNQPRMQAWGAVGGGHYTTFRNAGDLDIAFDRASCRLRRPAPYDMALTTSQEAPPKNGTLVVEVSPEQAVDGLAVGLILDASGSMRKRIDGVSRIDIAKKALTQLVQSTIPEGTPVSFRAFGHDQPGSCKTEQLVPLGPLKQTSMAKTIGGLQAKNLAKTPIGASLEAIRTDLAAHTGPRLVVLLTDGEETCGGDPSEAIANLEEAGLDVRMNIVGFAIDDAQVQADFETWARQLGGTYLSATNAEEVGSRLKQAMQPRVEVFQNNDLVASGSPDEPFSLPPGAYQVKVIGPTPFQKDVQIEPETVTKLQ